MGDSDGAKNAWMGDYQFLSQEWPAPSRAPRHTWLLDDVMLTVIIFLGAAYDLTSGSMNLGPTEWALDNVQGINATLQTDELVRATRVRGASGIESGVAAVLVGTYRVARWGRAQRFNGIIFQVTFFINTMGRGLQLALEVPGFRTPMPPGFYMLIGRLSLALVAFLISLYTYRSSWRWVWRP